MRVKGKGLDARGGATGSRGRVTWARRLGGLATLGVVAFVAGHSQVPQYNGGMPGTERTASGLPGLPENANPRPDGVRALRDSMSHEENLKRLKALNVQRQKDMNLATGKLITLANEVKAETNKSSAVAHGDANKDALSVADLRKVEMIEKLARSVREKMTATITVD